MKKITIEQENMIPCFPKKFSFIPKENEKAIRKAEVQRNKFTIGNIYTLSGVECDDFEMPKKEYQLIDIVKNINGVTLDSVVMKQISGEQSTIFSLTKNDCRNLRIQFQQGLQLFPTNLNWIEKKTETQIVEPQVIEPSYDEHFNPTNLSTYPLCHIDNTVRHILVELSNFSYDHLNGVIILPSGDTVKKSVFNECLKIRTKRPLYGDNKTSANIQYDERINYRILTKEVGNCTTNEVVDNNGNIYVELCLVKKTSNTPDGWIGVDPRIFDNANFSSVFDVYVITNDMTYRSNAYARNNSIPLRREGTYTKWSDPRINNGTFFNFIKEEENRISRDYSKEYAIGNDYIDITNKSSLDLLLENIRREIDINREYNKIIHRL